MAIQREIWVNYIIGNLFKQNPHLDPSRITREDEYVVGGRIVHIPQAGGKPNVVKNRSTLPATVSQRTDADIIYPLDEYTSDPTLIPNADMVELSYDKIDSVIGEHVQAIAEAIGDNIIYQWLAAFAASHGAAADIDAATVIRTTGATTAAHLPGATGNRKKFTKEDLKRARTILNKQNIPNAERFALLSSDMMDQLLDDTDLKQYRIAEMDMTNGVVTRLYGFTLLERSTTAVFDNAATPAVKAVGAASAATDNDSVICWQRGAVACALGEVNFFEDLSNPTYYGDVYSALVRMGGRKRRANAQGIVAIVQTP